MTNALEAAHEYRARGWALVPLYGVKDGACACPTGAACPSAGKHPHGRGGRWNVLTGGADVQAWFDDNPDDNIGIVTGPDSGIFVLDVDGQIGIDSITQLFVEHGLPPRTRVVKTGSGGLHYFFKHPADFAVHNSTSYIAKNVDIRGKGGQVVAPPSASGKGPYELFIDAEPAEAPAWLLTMLREHTDRVEQGARIQIVSGEGVDVEGLPDGLRDLLSEPYAEDGFKRYQRLHAIVAACFEANYTQGQTVTLVAGWAKRVGKFVGREPQEVGRSWGKIELEKQRQLDWIGDEAPKPQAVPDLAPDAEDTFWAARPILTHLHDFARARRVSPWAVLGCALARIIVATPPGIHLPPIVGGKASLNLFVGLVGPSGSGKGAAEAVAADALQVGFITTCNVGSGEGIAHGYKRRVKGELEWVVHEVLFSVPEIDSLAAQGDRKGATLMPQLRSGWTGEQLGFGYADPMKRIIVEAHEYRMGLIAGIQPGRAACLLDDSDGGTPQRFLWMPATDPSAPNSPPAQPRPWTWTHPAIPNGESMWSRGEMDVCEIAKSAIITNRLARLRGEGEALDGHALLAQLKTAAALALASGRTDVNEDDWALAEIVAQKSAATRSTVAEYLYRKASDANKGKAEAEATRAVLVDDRLTDAGLSRACRTIVRKVRRDGGITAGADLKRCLNSKDRGNFDAAIEALLEAGQLQVTKTEKGATYALEGDL